MIRRSARECSKSDSGRGGPARLTPEARADKKERHTGSSVSNQVVASILAVTLQVWVGATFASPMLFARPMCQAPATKGHGCCRKVPGGGEVPDCCKVKTQTSQPIVLIAPPTPDRSVTMTALAVEPIDSSALPAAQQGIDRAARSPLRLPHDPTYLRISVLLI